ncbi:spore coat protein CotS [Clostridium sp. AM58-1XD]|uniref:spore coat protein CotS n=1 Tax=Clostridium sp. AM58-1XD TaxID=2292307 RepID=UPI000E4A9BF5|nr:spore coat protein CotS [Clostridium sp. AM58-1XD]RGY99277.1 spore coat protein CotS [Clostridium sp. AM58-1XD]
MNEKYTEVLEQYDLELISARRGRGAWICETNQGLKLVREYKGTVKRLEFEEQVLTFVQDNGYALVDRYVRNREGYLVSPAEDGTRYIVKDWFADKECNLRDSGEVLKAVGQIAKLHRILKEIPFEEEWNMGSILAEPAEQEMERHNREMKRAKNFIRGKRKKTEFELCVIGNFEHFYKQAQEASQGMEDIGKRGEPELFLSHGDVNQHHVLMGNQGIAIIEFNKLHFGLQIEDLYHFMRKAMEKHDWNISLGLSILDVYDRVLPITSEDRERLYYLLLYPEKYWKQINFYYNANKAWIPSKNVEKLKNLEEQEENKSKFLDRIH